MAQSSPSQRWALILGASSGFGGATAQALARAGYHIAGVHLDRKGTLANVEQIVTSIEAAGRNAMFFNVNAADPERRKEVLDQIEPAVKSSSPPGQVMVLMHSLAFGSLRPFIADDPKLVVTKDQMDMTVDVMANALVYWTQDLFFRKLLGKGSHVLSMTSSGGTRVWYNYGPVSAAKAALESHTRQLALECAPHGIAVNCIRAGVTDTPALRKIPGSDEMIKFATMRNPHHRLTTTEDVAAAIVSLVSSPSSWITGNVIGVDGGEDVAG